MNFSKLTFHQKMVLISIQAQASDTKDLQNIFNFERQTIQRLTCNTEPLTIARFENYFELTWNESYYQSLTYEERYSCLAHEYYHALRGDLTRQTKRDLVIELECDTFAALIFGLENMVSALQKIQGWQCDAEIRSRIYYLRLYFSN